MYVCRDVHPCTNTRVTNIHIYSHAHICTKARAHQPLGVCAGVSGQTLHPAQPPSLSRASGHEGAGNTPSREESQSQSALITSHGMGSSIILEWQAGCGAHLLASRPPSHSSPFLLEWPLMAPRSKKQRFSRVSVLFRNHKLGHASAQRLAFSSSRYRLRSHGNSPMSSRA